MSQIIESADLTRRFSGLDRLLGVRPADRVRLAHVMVIGLGGVGSWAAEALARSGVGRITLVDMDHISESNINRQLHALSSTLGMAKIEAMRQRIFLINPACDVQCLDTFADAENWEALIADGVDAVLDACDQVGAKTAMAAWSVRTKTPFIAVGAAGGKRLAHAVDIADLSETTHDPLLAQVRYRLRKGHAAPKNGKKMKFLFQLTFVEESVVLKGREILDKESIEPYLNFGGDFYVFYEPESKTVAYLIQYE